MLGARHSNERIQKDVGTSYEDDMEVELPVEVSEAQAIRLGLWARRMTMTGRAEGIAEYQTVTRNDMPATPRHAGHDLLHGSRHGGLRMPYALRVGGGPPRVQHIRMPAIKARELPDLVMVQEGVPERAPIHGVVLAHVSSVDDEPVEAAVTVADVPDDKYIVITSSPPHPKPKKPTVRHSAKRRAGAKKQTLLTAYCPVVIDVEEDEVEMVLWENVSTKVRKDAIENAAGDTSRAGLVRARDSKRGGTQSGKIGGGHGSSGHGERARRSDAGSQSGAIREMDNRNPSGVQSGGQGEAPPSDDVRDREHRHAIRIIPELMASVRETHVSKANTVVWGGVVETALPSQLDDSGHNRMQVDAEYVADMARHPVMVDTEDAKFAKYVEVVHASQHPGDGLYWHVMTQLAHGKTCRIIPDANTVRDRELRQEDILERMGVNTRQVVDIHGASRSNHIAPIANFSRSATSDACRRAVDYEHCLSKGTVGDVLDSVNDPSRYKFVLDLPVHHEGPPYPLR